MGNEREYAREGGGEKERRERKSWIRRWKERKWEKRGKERLN